MQPQLDSRPRRANRRAARRGRSGTPREETFYPSRGVGGLPCGERIVSLQTGIVRERLDTMVDLF